MRACVKIFFSTLLDAVAPPRPTLRMLREVTLAQLQTLALRGARAGALPYHEPAVRALVWEVKYYANQKAAALAGQMLAEVLLGIAEEELGKPLLVPMPMHAARRRERGHNQAEVLCEAALAVLDGSSGKTFFKKVPARTEGASARSGGLGPPAPGRPDFFSRSFAFALPAKFLERNFDGVFDYAPNALVRERATPPQQGLQKYRRLTNVKNSMRAAGPDARRIAGRVCVVVDDVSTTGASLAEARRALLQAGARQVECIALAHS